MEEGFFIHGGKADSDQKYLDSFSNVLGLCLYFWIWPRPLSGWRHAMSISDEWNEKLKKVLFDGFFEGQLKHQVFDWLWQGVRQIIVKFHGFSLA